MIGQAYEEKCYAEKPCPEQPTIRAGGYAREIGRIERVDTPRKGIADELQTVRDLTNAAHEYVTMLEQKMAPFRRLSPQCEAKEQKVPRAIASEFAEELSSQNERLQVLCNRLSNLIEEIDL